MMHATFPTAVSNPIDLPGRLPRWPQRAVRCQYDSEAARQLLQQNGWDDLDRLFSLTDQSLHGHKGRAVSRVELRQPGGDVVTAYVKLNWGRRRLIPRMSDLKTRQAFQSLPFREWQGIADLKALGFLVPERMALLQRGRLRFQEAVVIQSVRPPYSLDELIRSGQWNQLPESTQQEILLGVVDVMKRIHESGLGWRGTCTRHFFPEKSAQGTWRFWLIDCEGVHRHVSRKNISRDYKKLNRALAISGADEKTLCMFQELTHATEADLLNNASPLRDPTARQLPVNRAIEAVA